MGGQTAMVKNVNMPEEMQQDAVECVMQSLEEHNVKHDIAAHEFDRKYNPTWQCTVGRNFVIQKTSHFILVCLGPVTVLIKGA
uniref:Dynein light chain n=1 Tax=Aquila chrysaetos chrysaetos TaxID=223781 RepID=A0A663EGQ0_AQUCH